MDVSHIHQYDISFCSFSASVYWLALFFDFLSFFQSCCAYLCLLVFACFYSCLLVFACVCLSLLVFACLCLSLHVRKVLHFCTGTCLCLPLLVFACLCLPLLAFACLFFSLTNKTDMSQLGCFSMYLRRRLSARKEKNCKYATFYATHFWPNT